MQQEAFRKGDIDTGFIGKYFKPELLKVSDEGEALVAALVGGLSFEKGLSGSKSSISKDVSVKNEGIGSQAWEKRKDLR
jgi:hypothetical protein